jgi:hypothetical protein
VIRLTKGEEPAILQENGQAWTNEYVAIIEAGDEIPEALRYRYREPQIKAALQKETHAKCAYCESKIRHVTAEHVEHILPKNPRPELVLAWDNLTLACPQCNQNKAQYYSEAEPLINPYVHDPEAHLLFHGPVVLPRPGSAMGWRTFMRLDLSRMDLVERKKERAIRLSQLIELWVAEEGPERKALLENEIRKEASDSSEYAAMVRDYLRHIHFPGFAGE